MRKALSLLVFCLPLVAQAADVNGVYFTGGGAGAVECPEFVASMEKGRASGIGTFGYVNQTQAFAAYFAGYQTAYNQKMPNTCNVFHGISMNQILSWTEGWCRANPLARVEDAIVNLANERHPQRLTKCN